MVQQATPEMVAGVDRAVEQQEDLLGLGVAVLLVKVTQVLIQLDKMVDQHHIMVAVAVAQVQQLPIMH
jgi:hypothetical protein